VDTALIPAASAGAQLYLAGAAAMAAQFGNEGQHLSAADKQFLETAFPNVYSQQLLDSVVIHYGCATPKMPWDGDTLGITFGHDIYLSPPGNMPDAQRIQLIGHELMHVIQYDRLGGSLFAFGYKYFQEYTKALIGYGGDAYKMNSMEQEAYTQQNYVDAAYNKAVKLFNDTVTPLTVTVSYQVPDPNPPTGGFYLTDPTISESVQVTIQPGQTVVVYDGSGQLLPVDKILSASGIINVQGTGPNASYSWSFDIDASSNTCQLDKVVNLVNDTLTPLTATVSYQVPDPNLPTGGFYLTDPTITESVLVTIQPGETVTLYAPGGQPLPVDQILSAGGIINVQGTGPNESWSFQIHAFSETTLYLDPYFGGI
jgi:hypothetical protein